MTRLLSRGAIVAAALLAAVTLAGCANGAASGTDPVGTWGDVASSTEPSLVLAEDGSLSGTDGCNRLVGTWKTTDDGIEFGPLASTRMACDGVKTWLGDATAATIAGTTMTFTNTDGKSIGTLDRTSTDVPSAAPTADGAAFVGRWGTGAEKPAPQLTLAEDGTLSGTDGCNQLAGAWTAAGETVEFGQVAVTMMACEGVDQWLGGLSSATVDGDTLTVLDAKGAVIGILPRIS